jgi:hypothetical protein
LLLTDFLRASFPELTDDNKFIAARSEAAVETYEQAVLNGSNPIEAEEQASVVLFQGLDFSKHDTLITILWNEFSSIIPESKAKEMAVLLLPECETVFAQYPLSDDFAGSSLFELLYTELTGAISLYLAKYGIR